MNESRYTVAHIAPTEKSSFIYEYDFGDSWRHKVVLEKILPPDESFKHPVCLTGKNACPPEDCGGIGGYDDLKMILADPDDPDLDSIISLLRADNHPAA